jgi:hypothetical protein
VAAVQGRCLGLDQGPANQAALAAFRILELVLAAAPSLPGVGTAAREANHSPWPRQARSSLGACYRRPTVGGVVDRTLFYRAAMCRVALCREARGREAMHTTEVPLMAGEPFVLPPWPHRLR